MPKRIVPVFVDPELAAPDPPMLGETMELFRCVAEHDFDALAALCDDDFGIVDLDPEGGQRGDLDPRGMGGVVSRPVCQPRRDGSRDRDVSLIDATMPGAP